MAARINAIMLPHTIASAGYRTYPASAVVTLTLSRIHAKTKTKGITEQGHVMAPVYHDSAQHMDKRNTRHNYRDNSTHSHRSMQDHRSSVQPNRARREQDHANTQRRARSVDHESVQFNNRDNRDRERKLGEEQKMTGISREILKNRYDNRHHHFDDDNFSIQLTAKNMCLGNVKDTTFIVVVDSGATHDIITQTTINGSPYLSSLEPTPCESISFTVAGGEHIQCKTKLKFDLSIQGVTFAICAYIMPDCGSVSMLIRY